MIYSKQNFGIEAQILASTSAEVKARSLAWKPAGEAKILVSRPNGNNEPYSV